MTTTPDGSNKTRWHRLLGKMLEEALTRLEVVVQTEVDVVSDSPKADIILLRRHGAEWTETQKMWLADGLRDSTAREELLEFKFTQSLTEDAIAQLFVYDHLYRAKQKLKRNDLQSFLLISRTPNTDILHRFGFMQSAKAGVYASEMPLFGSLRIILLNELTDEPHNAVLKCFSSHKRERKKAFHCLDQYNLSNLVTDLQMVHPGTEESSHEKRHPTCRARRDHTGKTGGSGQRVV